MTEPTTDDLPTIDDLPADGAEAPPCSYRAALEAASPWRLRAVLRELGVDPGRRSAGLADALADRLDEPGTVRMLIDALGPPQRQALGLFALAEAPSWPAVAFGEALNGLGIDQAGALDRPLALGLIAPSPPPADPDDAVTPLDRARVLGMRLVAHPAVLEAARVRPPEGPTPPTLDEPARLVREADGLEPVLRLAALWQLADAGPLKRTRQGDLYKRDRQRLDEDPALAGPIADVLGPIADPVALWLDLSRAVGLLVDEPESDRIVAAPPGIWSEHGVHLPQMIAARWLAGADLRPGPGDDPGPTLGLRPAALLTLAGLPEDAWVALDDLAALLGPRMGAPSLPEPPKADRHRGRAEEPPPMDPMAEALRSALLGPAYLLGLVRVGEAGPGGRVAVQLAPRGRYALGLGPPPPPPPRIEQFLFVQPNFEIVAYRQGLNPALIGRLSRFARWEQLGSALTLRLNSDSIDRGLASGLSAGEIRDWLARHGVRPTPDGVAGAIASWAGRRERLTFFASATLIEFATAAELEEALAGWPDDGPAPPPVRLADRVLLVEDEGAIPFKRFRLAGARDYRRPPEACVEVGPDGVSLAADPTRGDLFVEAELSRFADPAAEARADGSLRRRFVVSPGSLRRASAEGLTTGALAQWYAHRTGGPMPAAVRWLARVVDLDGDGPPAPLRAGRPLVLRAPGPEVLDGLLQHPDTRDLLGERLGPTAAVVRADDPTPLREALRRLGVSLEIE